jgi:hypothetical protein
MNKQDKKVAKEMKNLMEFSNMTIGEMKDLIKATLNTTYSTGAYDAVKKLNDMQKEIK